MSSAVEVLRRLFPGWFRPADPGGADPRPHKWLPVLRQSYCTGCGRCVEACESGCLEMVWAFATLQRPEACTSGGACAEACPEDLIRMEWVPATGDPAIGRWREGPES